MFSKSYKRATKAGQTPGTATYTGEKDKPEPIKVTFLFKDVIP